MESYLMLIDGHWVDSESTEYIEVSVRTTDGAGGWTAGTDQAVDVFVIVLTGPMGPLSLTTTDQFLDRIFAPTVLPCGLEYLSPLGNSLPAGDQSFTITFTAALWVP